MAKLLEYRGYHAKVEYEPEDNLLVGNVLGISDSLNFHAENTTDLIENFHNCIDNYLAFCEKIGKTPDKEYSGTFNVRVSPELHKKAFFRAQEDNTTLNKVVENALRLYTSTDTALIKSFTEWKKSFAESTKMMGAEPIAIKIKTDTDNVKKNMAFDGKNLLPCYRSSYSVRRKIMQ